ncbi:MAG: branched-chain amino acid aminotransferase [Alphaproteobacteria bacterium]|nr:branched-chain amino acid aminotransferase [Alphaproteobacteria bacterium]
MAGSQSYDELDGQIWMNGKLVPWAEAKAHYLTHGLHYASCVFEGQRVYSGRIFKLEEHTQRLFASARMLDMKIPFSEAEINEANRQVVAANNMVDGYVRPAAWRGSEMMGVSAQKNRINVAIAVWQWPAYFSPQARMKGIRLDLATWRRPDPRTAPALAKAAGLYMICTLSKHTAESKGFDDALMLDWRGQIAEATGANIFLVIGGELHTPTPDCFLDGITRRTVMGLAKNRQIKVVERAIMPDELGKASEVFITGTAAEVTPVAAIGDYTFTPGRVCQVLMQDYEALVREQKAA